MRFNLDPNCKPEWSKLVMEKIDNEEIMHQYVISCFNLYGRIPDELNVSIIANYNTIKKIAPLNNKKYTVSGIEKENILFYNTLSHINNRVLFTFYGSNDQRYIDNPYIFDLLVKPLLLGIDVYI